MPDHPYKPGPQDRTIMGGVEEMPTGHGANSPYLCIIYPRDLNKRYELTASGLTLGRGEDVDVVLPDGMVSREHCRVTLTDDHVHVEDLKSTNGTLIDGQSVTSAYLPLYGRLKVGPFVLKVEYKNAAEIRYDEHLFAAATTDPLTSIPNRRWLLDQGLSFLADFRQADQVVSAVMLDIDHFKRVNDTYGHPAGDAVICGVANILDQEKRELDLLGRYGGEEFLMFLPTASPDEAASFCERIRAKVQAATFEHEGQALKVTVSVGVASRARGDVSSLEEMIAEADSALYEAKRGGRNRVCSARLHL